MTAAFRRFARLTIALALLLTVRSAWAKPEYARKEEKACQFCHVSVTPNQPDEATGLRQSTARNPRGVYYQSHNHSFEGYSEKQVMGVSSPPVFHPVWKEELTDAPRRIAVADVTGDGKPRLIALNESPERRGFAILTVKKWDGKSFVTEFTAPVQASSDKLAVGQFAGKDKPAVIVTGDALWYWDGKTFAKKPSSRPLPLFATARLKSGNEYLVLIESSLNAKTPDFKAYRVDTNAAEWLTDRSEAPNARQVSIYDMRESPEFFQKMGMQPMPGGIIGLWDVRQFGTIFFYYVRPEEQLDTTGAAGHTKDPQNNKINLKGILSRVAFRDPTKDTGGELWYTPKLDGMALDVARDDAKGGGKPGLLVLTNGSESGKGRTLYFFALD